jgi:hypothetical protein
MRSSRRSIAYGVIVSFRYCTFESVQLSLLRHYSVYGMCVKLIPGHAYYEYSVFGLKTGYDRVVSELC